MHKDNNNPHNSLALPSPPDLTQPSKFPPLPVVPGQLSGTKRSHSPNPTQIPNSQPMPNAPASLVTVSRGEEGRLTSPPARAHGGTARQIALTHAL